MVVLFVPDGWPPEWSSSSSLDLLRESVRGGADCGEGWPAASGERRWWGGLAGGELGEQRRPHLGEEESSGAGGERRVSGEREMVGGTM